MKTSTKLAGYLFAAGVMAMSPISAFATEGSGTNGLSFYDYLSANADKDTVIDFNEAPATGNVVDEATGSVVSDIGGLYMLQSTKDEEKPMYFFRGNVEDNNVILNNFCWLMVRTTETGGTKLLYNGTPIADGQCPGDPDWGLDKLDSFNPNDPSTWPKTIVGFSVFNEQDSSPSDFGYMYGDRFESTRKSSTDTTVFGNDVTYVNGTYTLQDIVVGGQNAYNGHHYTCLTTGTTCSEVYYMVHDAFYFLAFSGGDTLDTALAKMAENKHDSKIKTFIEDWYAENMTEATDYLEDTIWYGGKTFASGALSTKDSNYNSNFDQSGISYTKEALDVYYHGASREEDSRQPRNDVSFDYSDPNGIYTVANGTLKYPVGMLTNSEIIMAGNGDPASAKGTYIDDDFAWWALSPFAFYDGVAGSGLFLGIDGSLRSEGVHFGYGVRPSVSLKSTLSALEGDGSKEKPFRNLVEIEDSEDETTPAEDETSPLNPQTADLLPLAILSVTALATVSYVATKRKTMR